MEFNPNRYSNRLAETLRQRVIHLKNILRQRGEYIPGQDMTYLNQAYLDPNPPAACAELSGYAPR